MKEILIFAGTTEGRKLSEYLADAEIRHTVCVATEYGEIVLKKNLYTNIHCGRMNQEEIKLFISNGNFAAVVDATHPYAEVVTENIRNAMNNSSIPYIRMKREITSCKNPEEQVFYFDSNEACEKALHDRKGNILLTTGSKELAKYCISEEIKERLYTRILPSLENLSLCMEQGIRGKQIIAMQGPFSEEMNEAILKQFRISVLVTKASGRAGGYHEKLAAARKARIPVYVIGQPKDDGYTFEEVCNKLEEICERNIGIAPKFDLILTGIGMGNPVNLTREVEEAIADADILLGAERMLVQYQPKIEKRPYYLARQIIPYLKEIQNNLSRNESRKIAILFSGDSGFYSGCQSLYRSLQEEIETGGLNASIQVMPGISSVAYLASCTGESYQDAAICSMHGKKLNNLVRRICTEEKLFLLMSGVGDVNRLGKILSDAGLYDCEIIAGYQLSYPEQKILKLTPMECCGLKEEGLYTCLIKNPNVKEKYLTHGIQDGAFVRGKVPMTKEEIREVSICKLHLKEKSVVYDIGSGTGSITAEMARLSNDIQVYAVEQKAEAVSLIRQNCQKFQLDNVNIIEAKAPEGLLELPPATHAFIGGSGGQMKEILDTLYQINPTMRIVVNAISMETISEMQTLLSKYKIEKEEILQMQVNRAKTVGKYHLMQSENPVWIFAFNFCE